MAIGDATSGVSTSGGIYFSGIGSGTDFSSMIDKLVQVEQSRVTTYQTWKQSWAEKNTAFQTLNTTMLTLRTTLEGMDTINTFLKKSATSSDTTEMSATATGGADSGSYTYTIAQLAKNKMMVTASGYSSLTQSINSTNASESFVYTYKGTTVSDTIPAGATLTDLVNIINAQSSNTGVRASTIYDGTKYYLQFRGLDTGESAALVISGATNVSGFQASDFVTTQMNQDSKFKINGWPLSNAYISRATNSVSDVIDGVTMNLLASGSGTMTVATDVDAVVENVKSFVTQVNNVRSQLYDLTKYDSTNQQGSLLTGNYGLDMINSALEDITASAGLGFDVNRDTYTSLSSLGLSTDADESSTTFGQILFDEDTFRAIMASNADAVGRIFAAQFQGDTNSADVSYNSYISGLTKAGEYSLNYTVSNGKLTSATIDGHPTIMSSNSNFITGMNGYDESGLVLRVNNLTNGTYSHNVYLRQGKTGELVDELGVLTDSTNGPLAVLEENYSDIQTDIQNKIDSENVRIQTMATNLKDQYSRLDTLLGQYGQTQTSLQSYIAQLGTSG